VTHAQFVERILPLHLADPSHACPGPLVPAGDREGVLCCRRCLARFGVQAKPGPALPGLEVGPKITWIRRGLGPRKGPMP
jgi:hypothetical protein